MQPSYTLRVILLPTPAEGLLFGCRTVELSIGEVVRWPLVPRTTRLNKGKKRRGPGPITCRPSPLLASVVGARTFLALLLSASSQEVVRDSPYRVRDPAYRIRDPAYRSA